MAVVCHIVNVSYQGWEVLRRTDVQIRRHSQGRNSVPQGHDSRICQKISLPAPSWKKVQALRRVMPMAC